MITDPIPALGMWPAKVKGSRGAVHRVPHPSTRQPQVIRQVRRLAGVGGSGHTYVHRQVKTASIPDQAPRDAPQQAPASGRRCQTRPFLDGGSEGRRPLEVLEVSVSRGRRRKERR